MHKQTIKRHKPNFPRFFPFLPVVEFMMSLELEFHHLWVGKSNAWTPHLFKFSEWRILSTEQTESKFSCSLLFIANLCRVLTVCFIWMPDNDITYSGFISLPWWIRRLSFGIRSSIENNIARHTFLLMSFIVIQNFPFIL